MSTREGERGPSKDELGVQRGERLRIRESIERDVEESDAFSGVL